MELSKYIKEHGATACAERFGASKRAVYSWASGERTPRVKQAAKIVAGSDGAVSYTDIYKPGNPAELITADFPPPVCPEKPAAAEPEIEERC